MKRSTLMRQTLETKRNDLPAMIELQREWVGHDEAYGETAATQYAALVEYIDAVAEDEPKDICPGYVAFLAEFPKTIRDFGTGGGCTAFCIELSRNRYVLLTDDNLTSPAPEDTHATFGAYEDINDCNEPIWSERELLTWEEIARRIRFLA